MITKERIKLDARIDLKNKFNYSIALDDYRIGGMKWNDVDNGRNFEFSVNKQDILDALHINQTQIAIECLKEINRHLCSHTVERDGYEFVHFEPYYVLDLIDNKIKELGGDK